MGRVPGFQLVVDSLADVSLSLDFFLELPAVSPASFQQQILATLRHDVFKFLSLFVGKCQCVYHNSPLALR